MYRKKVISVILTLLLLLVCVTACQAAGPGQTTQSQAASPGQTSQSQAAEKEAMIYAHIGEKTLAIRPESNSSAEALVELLQSGDITVDMHDYGSFEKVGPLGTTLPTNDERITTEPGDVILYQGNQITIYYDTNTWSFTRLGKVQGLSPEEIRAVLGDGDLTAVFSLKQDVGSTPTAGKIDSKTETAGTGVAVMAKASEPEEKQMTSETTDLTLAQKVSESEDHYIFNLREDVTREKIYYRTRFGIEIAADLYRPKNFNESGSYAGIVIGPPFGGVKEQGPGVYANELASRGFVALAFDPAYHGYSGGAPRYTGSSSTYVEDFSAGVDYLGSLSYIDREKIGVLGICGSGGFAVSAASMDTRIKAVVTSALYDIAGNMNEIGGQARQDMLAQMAQLRWNKVDTGEDMWMKAYPDEPAKEVPAELQGDSAEFFEFYGMERGWHPNALGNVTGETMPDLMTLPTTGHVGELNIPLLMITGDIAHSRAFTEAVYERASEPKEMVVVEGARHIDLYDDVAKIPFDKIESFFKGAFRNLHGKP